MKYRAEIDGLRALAVIPVILFHAGFDEFSGGFVGVDVFFVISGYLITNIIISELEDNRFSIVNFYERRARRLLPALFFVMLCCIPFAWLWLNPTDLKDFGESLIAVSTFSSNFLFWLESGYFETKAELKPLLHTWSLAVEEQYYILFPVFLIAMWRMGSKYIITSLIIIFLVSFGIAEWSLTNMPSSAFFLLPSRGWELLIGVFTAFYLKNNSFFKSHILNQTISILGLGMIIYSIIIFEKNTVFPGFNALIPTIGTALIILTAVSRTFVHKILVLKPIVAVGLISYSAYLWHQPLLAFAKYRIVYQMSELFILALCSLSIFVAWLSWRFIEKPFRDKKRISRKIIFQSSLISIFIFSVVGFLLHYENGYPNRANFSQELSASFKRPALDNCFDLPFNHDADKWGCNLGAHKDKVDYILFGDSHALSLKSMIDEIGKKNNTMIFFTGSSGCIPFLGIFPKRTDQKVNNCNYLNTRVFKLASEDNIKGIILAARWSYYTLGDYDFKGGQLIANNKDGPFTLDNSIKAFSESFNYTVSKYKEIKVPIHLIGQVPHQIYSPESAYFMTSKGFTDLKSVSVSREKFNELNKIPLDVFISHEDSINFYDVTDFFCDVSICPLGTKNQSFYYDDDHLSTSGANKIRPMVEKIFL